MTISPFDITEVRALNSFSILEDSAKTFLQSLSGKQLEQCTEDTGMILYDCDDRGGKKHHIVISNMADIDSSICHICVHRWMD